MILTTVRTCISLFPEKASIDFSSACTVCACASVTMGLCSSTPVTKLTNFHQLTALNIDKAPVDFSTLAGKVVLVVNVASK